MAWSQCCSLATWSPTKCFLHWHVIPTCWQPPYRSLVMSVLLCCQSMVLMSFWLCNTFRSNTHRAIFPDTVFNQSDSHWACFSFLKLLSSLCLEILVWESTPASFVFYATVLDFEKILHFSSMSLTGAVSNISHFPVSVSVSPAFCSAHPFCHSPIQTLLVLCPIFLQGYPCTRSNHKYFVPLSKELLKAREFLGQRQKKGRRYVSFVLGEGIIGWKPKAQYRECGTAPHHLFQWGFCSKMMLCLQDESSRLWLLRQGMRHWGNSGNPQIKPK